MARLVSRRQLKDIDVTNVRTVIFVPSRSSVTFVTFLVTLDAETSSASYGKWGFCNNRSSDRIALYGQVGSSSGRLLACVRMLVSVPRAAS